MTTKRENAFRATVAFYPNCYESLFHLDSPILILIGDQDDWGPAEESVSSLFVGVTNSILI